MYAAYLRLWLWLRRVVNIAAELFLCQSRDRAGALTRLTGYNHERGVWERDKIRIFILGRGLVSSPDPSVCGYHRGRGMRKG